MGYGEFGANATAYDRYRDGLPDPVVRDFLSNLADIPRDRPPRILDLGCGTGLISRQLASAGCVVVGVDKDPLMIRTARRHPLVRAASTHGRRPPMRYLVAEAEALPLGTSEFDGVVIASALHWFANNDALQEIRRVLRPGGVVLVVNKAMPATLRRALRRSVARHSRQALPDIKAGYDPRALLESAGFCGVIRRTFHYPVKPLILSIVGRLFTNSLWNLIPPAKQRPARQELTACVRSILRHRTPRWSLTQIMARRPLINGNMAECTRKTIRRSSGRSERRPVPTSRSPSGNRRSRRSPRRV